MLAEQISKMLKKTPVCVDLKICIDILALLSITKYCGNNRSFNV